jgi:two-component system, chemotaxis family, chemotaxis protein CheY
MEKFMADILVVDDSATVCNEVSSFLSGSGLTVETAFDGQDGFEKIQRGSYKLIICDVNMPRMDGLTMCEKVRAAGKASLPIIMLTTESSSSMKDRGKAAGVRAWIVKPFNGVAAIKSIKTLVGC